MQPIAFDTRYLIRYVLNSAQGTRAKGDGKATYTAESLPIQIFFRPAQTTTENTPTGLVKRSYIPAVTYATVGVGDCLGNTTVRQFKIVSVNEIPMSGGQKQLELKKL